MAASLASRLAASLPTTQASAPSASTPQTAKETIPKSLAHAVDVEAEIPLESVRIDSLVSCHHHRRPFFASNQFVYFRLLPKSSSTAETPTTPMPPESCLALTCKACWRCRTRSLYLRREVLQTMMKEDDPVRCGLVSFRESFIVDVYTQMLGTRPKCFVNSPL